MSARHGSLRRGILAAVMAVVALGGPGAAVAAEGDTDTVRIGMAFEPGSMNPFLDYSGAWQWFIAYDYLTNRGLDMQPGPGFADSWTSSDDGKVWTFTVAPDRKWSDGEPATADDVAFTIDYLLDSVASENELNVGWLNLNNLTANLESYRLVDSQTIELTMKAGFPQDDPPALDMFIMPRHIWQDVAYADVATSSNVPMVGSGPYVVSEWQSGQFIRMTRNEFWRGPAPVAAELIYVVYATPDARIQALKQGEIDAAYGIPAPLAAQLGDAENVQVVAGASEQMTRLVYNTLGTAAGASTDATADPAFRAALGHAIDKQALVTSVINGAGIAGTTIVPPTLSSYFTDLAADLRAFDIAQAQAALEAAGYVDSDGDGIREDKSGKPLSLGILISSDQASHATAAQFLTDWFKEAGVELTATAVDGATQASKLKAPDAGGGGWDLAIDMWWPNLRIGDALDVALTRQIGGSNRAYWSSEAYDSAFADLSVETDPSARAAIAATMQQLVYTQAPFDVLYYGNQTMAHRTDVFANWLTTPPGNGFFRAFSLQPMLTSLTAAGVEPSEAPSASAAPATEAPTTAPSASPSGGSGTTGGDSTPTVIIIGLVAAVVIVVGVVIMRRRQA